MSYLANYGLFFAKILTLVIAMLILTAGMISLFAKNKVRSKDQISIKKINEKYQDTRDELQQVILTKKAYKAWHKAEEKAQKAQENDSTHRRRVYVIRFDGDIKASAVETLREEVTAVLSVATSQDEVVVCLESAGGMVHSYGLAASQLQRIREKNIPLIVSVDKVAASGGYLMACVANKILAAPFAIIGSIGVIAQLPNFHRWLQKNEIDFEQVSAGEYKRTLTVFGENTEKGREKLKHEIEEIHQHFKDFITLNRAIVNVDQVATGEHWLATKAIEFNLVDELITSDDYLYSASSVADIFAITLEQKKSFSDKISSLFYKGAESKVEYLFR